MECAVEKVLSYIKETLIKDNPSLSLGDLEELNADIVSNTLADIGISKTKDVVEVIESKAGLSAIVLKQPISGDASVCYFSIVPSRINASYVKAFFFSSHIITFRVNDCCCVML